MDRRLRYLLDDVLEILPLILYIAFLVFVFRGGK